ncbi:PREDICTED: putative gustatory receptor 28a [Habropoda laboriosa]|uniref:putative gustatory receptor 28a n=1 Tax=Habropoda laboriosa TaxID=597456 RepID=UPI00083E444C|nr:PREDICTED: putative gustatory receptor 28a [Habropoda laboriosa]
MKKINSYKEATNVITRISQITSLRNFQDWRKNKFKFVCSWLYDIFILCLYTYTKYNFDTYMLHQMPYNSERAMITFLKYVFIIGFLILAILSLYHSKNTVMLMKEIDKVDENLQKLGCAVEYRSLYIHVVLVGLFWFLSAFILSTIYIKWLVSFGQTLYLYHLCSTLSYVYGTNVASIVLYDFKIYVYWLGHRFKQTNELLRTFLVEGHQIKTEDTVVEKSNVLNKRFRLDRWLSEHSIHRSRVLPLSHPLNIKHESQSVKKVHLLQQIRFVHLQLCGVSKMVNRIFNGQLIVYVAMTLTYITIILYYLYTEVYKPETFLSKLSVITVLLIEVLSYCVKIALVSYNCEYTTNQANRTIEIIHACSVYDIDTELKDEILQFSLQMSHTQLGKSKSAYFRLNYSFIRDCISFVATYLVIMIQWNQTVYSINE